MKYKLIASDMDETFLNDKSEIPKNNLEIVKLLDEDYGIKFVPASGRGQNSLQNEIKWLGFDKLDDEYIIGLNGAAITKAKDGEILYFKGLDFITAEELFKYGLKKDVGIQVYTNNDLYVYNINDDEARLMKEKGIKWQNIQNNIDFLKNQNIAKVIFQNTNMNYLREIINDLEGKIRSKAGYTFSSNRYLEFISPKVNKGEGIKNLCRILGINVEEVIAIGDNHNDLEMLKVAGLSVAVSNAVDEIKNVVDYVADSSNNDGVLEEIYEKFIKPN